MTRERQPQHQPQPQQLPRSAVPVLAAVASGSLMGTVYRSGDGRLAFMYDDSWRHAPHAYPLSLSMPLGSPIHGNGAIKPWLWGLMPDDPTVLDGWGKRFGVSSVDLVGLLTAVGEECSGAVQFVRPQEVERLLVAPHGRDAEADGSVEWIDNADIARRLRELRANAAAGRRSSDRGQFSLAGAQPKTALYEAPDGRWGVPTGRWPTNRILKPPVLPFEAIAWNEQLCLELVRRLGWHAARSSVRTFADDEGSEQVLVVERYDRVERNGVLTRVHQEDGCQALRVLPTRKYESQGGPSVHQLATLITNVSSAPTEDLWRFLDAVALHWLIGGTDAHGKNFALLLAAGQQVRLAPLYDVISILPYPEALHRDDTLAMGIGGERRLADITRVHWERLGGATGVGRRALVDRVAQVAEQVVQVTRALREEQPETPFVHPLMRAIELHATRCLERLTAA